MAAGRSKIESIHRGAKTGQGAKVLREGLAPLPSLQLYVPAIDTLEEICGWLGTFRERLRVAHTDERADLHKSRAASDVIDTIRKVAAGMSLITPAMVARLVSRGHDREHMRDSLSPREREVLQLLADGIASRQIAQRLGISYSTVRTHIRSISEKLGTKSKVNTVVTARDLELVN